jgi:hypothetical protein
MACLRAPRGALAKLYTVASSRITHVEIFELHAHEAVLARFEELSAPYPGAE